VGPADGNPSRSRPGTGSTPRLSCCTLVWHIMEPAQQAIVCALAACVRVPTPPQPSSQVAKAFTTTRFSFICPCDSLPLGPMADSMNRAGQSSRPGCDGSTHLRHNLNATCTAREQVGATVELRTYLHLQKKSHTHTHTHTHTHIHTHAGIRVVFPESQPSTTRETHSFCELSGTTATWVTTQTADIRVHSTAVTVRQ
jgi:hypothetical protein